MGTTKLDDLLSLPAEARADLAMARCESLDQAQRGEELTLSSEQKQELEKRLAEHEADPTSAIPWEEVKKQLKSGG